MNINRLNNFLSNADLCYRFYKNASCKNEFINTLWLHEDFSISAKSRIGNWLDRWSVTRCIHRFLLHKFYHIDLNSTYESLNQLQTVQLTPEQKKQLKRACKLLACFGRAKLGWREDHDKFVRLNEIIRACRNPKSDPAAETIVKDLWRTDDFPAQELKYWQTRPLKPPEESPLNFKDRSRWVKQGRDAELGMCGCENAPAAERVRFEKEIVTTLVARCPPATHPEISILSLGSGALLQDWILLNELAEQKYHKIKILLVDEADNSFYNERFKRLAEGLAKAKNIEIVIESANSIPSHVKVDCIHAIDFKLSEEQAWNALTKAQNNLTARGFIYTTSFGSTRFIFHKGTEHWMVSGQARINPVLPDIPKYQPVKLAIQDFENFWRFDLGFLMDLYEKGRRRFVLDVKFPLSFDKFLEKLLKNLFPEATFTLTHVSQWKPNTYHCLTITKEKLSREHYVENTDALVAGGTLLLKDSPYYQVKK